MEIGRGEIDVLRRAGVLSAGRYAGALALVRDDRAWARWARHALLALGLGHLLAGIVFFFAYNWADFPDLGKFATIELGILIGAGAALWRGADRPEGAAALIGATVLTGVLLAVVGQVYHSRAEAWQLFALWAGLTLPWALASRSAAHWLVWLVVLHLAAIMHAQQVLVPRGRLSEYEALVGLSLLPLLVLLLREAAVDRGQGWAGARWTRLLPAIAALGGLFVGAVTFLFDVALPEILDDPRTPALAPAAFLAAIATLGAVYRFLRPDLAVLAAAIGFAALFLIAAAVRLVAEGIGFDETEPLLSSLALLVVWSVAVVAGTARMLDSLRRRLKALGHG